MNKDNFSEEISKLKKIEKELIEKEKIIVSQYRKLLDREKDFSDNIDNLYKQQVRENIITHLEKSVKGFSNPEDVISISQSKIKNLTNVDSAVILLFDKIQKQFYCVIDEKNQFLSSEEALKLIEPFANQILLYKKPVIKDFSEAEEPVEIIPDIAKEKNIFKAAFYPIIDSEGVSSCMILMLTQKQKSFDEETLMTIEEISKKLADRISSTIISSKLNRLEKKDNFIRQIHSEMRSLKDLHSFMTFFSMRLRELICYERLIVIDFKGAFEEPSILLDDRKVKHKDFTDEKELCMLIKEVWNAKALKEQTLEIANVEKSDLPEKLKEELLKHKINSFLIVPILTCNPGEGGILLMQKKESQIWNDFEKNLAKELSLYVSIAVKRINLMNQTALMANISHEIKNPLTIISGYADALLKDKRKFKQEEYNLLLSIKENSDRAHLITKYFLVLSKFMHQDTNNEIEKEYIKISSLLEKSAKDCSSEAKTKSLKIELSVKKDFEINVNKILLQQAIENLIFNAIKNTSNRGKIKLESVETDNKLEIRVIDNGCGMGKEKIEDIYNKFLSGHSFHLDSHAGFGLGLMIVNMIAKLHEGEIKIESEINKGSTFTIVLPKNVNS